LNVRLTHAFTFEAAHRLPNVPSGHKCARLHGHSFRVEATVRGPEHGPVGWVEDLAELDTALKAIAGELDHGLLNEKPGLESPTLEHLCLHFAERLKGQFPGLSRVMVSRPTIGESCTLAL